MREIIALTRASWQSASSYKLGLVVSLFGFVAAFIPMFFVANAIQPIAASSIATESSSYFSFLMLGLIMQTVLAATVAKDWYIAGTGLDDAAVTRKQNHR